MLAKILSAQLMTSQFNQLKSIQNKKDVLIESYRQWINTKNILKNIFHESTELLTELELQIVLAAYKMSIDNINDHSFLNEEYERLVMERASTLHESESKLAKQWGL
jgi:hypothetical protein